jgi:hypothetical protein
MPSVAEALRQHVTAYLKKFDGRIPLQHRKVLSSIVRCRTGELGSLVYRCESCDKRHWVGRSCGNRHCPNCQKQKTSQWLAKQTDKLLSVQHFVVTFTVPQELRLLLRGNQKVGYDAIFNAGSQTIRALLKNPKFLGSDKVGFFGALHTWGRDLKDYHPHVHFVVPGGGVSPDGSRWLQTPANFLFPHARGIALYKKLFVQQLRKAGLYDSLPAGVLKKKWVVDIKPVGSGAAVLKYLAPYVYRVAISDNRIENVTATSVTYRVRPSGKNRSVSRTVDGEQFVRSFAQHVLPSGFQKIRYYGFMSPNCKLQLEHVRWLVRLHRGWSYWLASGYAPQQKPKSMAPSCGDCGGLLSLIAITDQHGQVVLGNPAAESLPTRGPP